MLGHYVKLLVKKIEKMCEKNLRGDEEIALLKTVASIDCGFILLVTLTQT